MNKGVSRLLLGLGLLVLCGCEISVVAVSLKKKKVPPRYYPEPPRRVVRHQTIDYTYTVSVQDILREAKRRELMQELQEAQERQWRRWQHHDYHDWDDDKPRWRDHHRRR